MDGSRRLSVSMDVTNDTGVSQKFNTLLVVFNLSARTPANSQEYPQGVCSYPNVSANTSTWPYYDAVKTTAVLNNGSTETVTWTNALTLTDGHEYWLWCSGMIYGPWRAWSPAPTPTLSPSPTPSVSPTLSPTITPTISPTISPTVSPTPSPTEPPGPGDANGDYVINCLDITQLELCILFPETYPKEDYPGWDADENGEGPNSGDIMAVVLRILEQWPP